MSEHFRKNRRNDKSKLLVMLERMSAPFGLLYFWYLGTVSKSACWLEKAQHINRDLFLRILAWLGAT